MKILHVAYIYPPKLRVADGITNVVYNVTKELAKRGNQVTVYASDMLDLHSSDSLNEHDLVINEVNVHYSRSLWRYKTFIATPSIIPLLSKNISNFDILHIHDCRSFQGIFAYLFAKIKKVPYVFQPHGSYLSSLPDSPSKKVIKNTLDKLVSNKIIRSASKVIALSHVEAEQYRCVGVPNEKIAIIPNGIDLSEYANIPLKNSFKKKFDIPEDKKIILYLGRIHRTKGLDLLVKAYAYLIKNLKHNDAILVMAGPDDGYLAKVKSLSDSLCVSDSMLFTGFINSDDKLKALVDADVFVTTSFYGFPVTFLEACAVGTPIVTTTLGDYLEWINENVGYVTLPTHHMLAEAMYAIISNHELSEKFSWNGQRLVRTKFSLQKVVDKLENIYSEVVNVKYG